MPDKTERLKKILKDNGLKVTSQRILILNTLEKRPNKHLTVEEIYELVRKKNPDIGLATVYRTIQLFSDLHLIDKLNLDDRQVRYEISKKGQDKDVHHHHHLICLECEQIISFEDDLLDNLEDTIEKTKGFIVKDHEVNLYGYCRKCLNNKEKTEED